jgi:hypothetical protein
VPVIPDFLIHFETSCSGCPNQWCLDYSISVGIRQCRNHCHTRAYHVKKAEERGYSGLSGNSLAKWFLQINKEDREAVDQLFRQV